MKTPLQEYLEATPNPLETITAELGIIVNRHPTLPLVCFKYDQINSPKKHPVVIWSRGTVLEDKTWRLVAQPFRRFFNAGEDPEEQAKFVWEGSVAMAKEDGSLIILYHYAGAWRVNTSGSFAQGEMYEGGPTWERMFWQAFNGDASKLDPAKTYIFELCSPYNHVVRIYPKPQVFLLSVFTGVEEMSHESADEEALRIGVGRPQVFNFSVGADHFKAVEEFLFQKSQEDRTFEGVVVRDANNQRMKIKTETYVALHHMHGNGNIFLLKNLIPVALSGESDEIVTIWPELRQPLDDTKRRLEESFTELVEIWEKNKAIEVQKDFALAIKSCRFSGLLFQLRKEKGAAGTAADLREKWRQSADLILKFWVK